ncbi:MAG: formate dehydrogenase subunit delta [Rhizomicrobium sp.]
MSTDDKLIYMANQIAGFFAAQGEARAVAGIGDHIRKYWDPRMRGDFLKLARADTGKLNPLVHKALPLIGD